MTQLLISHRGNTNGSNSERENSLEYIIEALNLKFDVEIDVWFVDNKFYLGHDYPKYKINKQFLKTKGLWCHAKNLTALTEMLFISDINCFWHQEDDVTLTSKNYIWTYPGKPIANKKAIAVCPERVQYWDISTAYGICSDFIKNF